MGLAAPKKRVKLSHDPNNTKWTNDTRSFGHRIMTSQGWQPGQYLGAKDAKHAEFHTAANASHIRVSIKVDNLGLGAKIGGGIGHGECTGLDAFKNLLGRLNGKDEDELVKEQQSRDNLRRAIYTERRWGSVRFVQGGFLIGDKIQHLIDGEAERIRKLAAGESTSGPSESSSSEFEDEAPALVEKTKKPKKRKIEVVENDEPEAVALKVKKLKKKRKSEASPADEADVISVMMEEKIAKKKAKKERKEKEALEDTPEETDLKKRKKNKKERKEKKDKKENATSDAYDGEKELKKKKKSKRDKLKVNTDLSLKSSEPSRASTKESTPTTLITVDTSGRSTPLMGGRHAVRARNIAQKQLASMDVASLNQIFMIKS